MYAKYQINQFTLPSGTTASTINIPVSLDFQLVDNAELAETTFVDVQVQEAINPILDYEKVRYIPVDYFNNIITNVNYNVNLLGNNGLLIPTYYSDIGFSDSELTFETNYFTQSYLELSFYDTDNTLTQNLITQIEIYSMLTPDDHYQQGSKTNGVYIIAGQAKPASQVPVRFVVSNPLMVSKAFYEGYHLYDYKDDVSIGVPKDLYMRATYFNAKTGIATNLMTDSQPYTIDNLVNKLHTRYILFRDTNSFYYQIDNTYSNVTYVTNQNNTNIFVELYQIQAL